MSYVDALWSRDKNVIYAVERHADKGRVYVEYPAKYVFYYLDNKGKYRNIYDKPVGRFVSKSWTEFSKELRIHSGSELFESDINPVFRCLADNYLGVEPPKLNIAYWDIEVDFDPLRGYSSPEDAFMPITSIAVHLQWLDTLVCLAVPPKTLTMEAAQKLVEEFPNTILFNTEKEMLDTFLSLIEDADVLSGWNSEGFDMPYTVHRIIRTMGKDATKRLCLWDQLPKKRKYEKYGKESVTYDLIGRVHVDSLEMYRKYTYEERHSYSLDAIAEFELGETKTPYEGTLDQLYNNDFKKFIEYNRQDTALLDKLDKKLKFIELANAIAHQNTVLIQTTMGAVAVTEQAIINEAHARGFIVPSRSRSTSTNNQAAGAYVAYPKKGLHKWIGATDINSLYPSLIRALNMGPETLIGQVRQTKTDAYIAKKMDDGHTFASAWEGMFGSLEYDAIMSQSIAEEVIIDWENGKSEVMSAAQAYDLFFNSNKPYVLTANGTIFTQEREGIIPGLLTRWYSERKVLQATLANADSLVKGVDISEEYAQLLQNFTNTTAGTNTNPASICKWIEACDVNSIKSLIIDGILEVSNNKIKYVSAAYGAEQLEYWDKRQLVRKILLNSLYGAILNEGCRFFDKRIGQSTTLSGRQVVKHMCATVNETITGEYSHVGEAVIYSDTDSVIGSTMLETSQGQMSIENAFNSCSTIVHIKDKEYAYNDNLLVMSYDERKQEPYLGHINYVYRHKVSKAMYEIEDCEGNVITVTEDHSVMIERNNQLISVKPADIVDSDILISINTSK